MNDFKIYFQFYFQFLLISTFNLIAQFELLNNQNPLFNSSLFMSASGSALANLLPTEKIIENDINKNIISSQDDKKDYRLTAKNITLLIPELHYSSSNGLIELSSINITADFLEVESADKHQLDDKPSNLLYEYPELASSINKSLNPCNDFYEFVCSGWKQNNPIDGDKTSSNQFQLISNLIEEREKEILDDHQHFHSYPPYDKMMFNLYDSCLDSSNRLKIGSSLLLQKMRKLKQRRNMKYITDWLINVWPVNLFYQISVGPDMRNTSKNIITITPNNVFLMSEKLYLEENMAPKYLEALKEYLTQLLELLYSDDNEQIIFKKINKKEDISRRVNSFIQVELLMAKIINETDKHYDNAYADDEYLILHEFQNNLAGTINWARYLQNILPQQVLLQKFSDGVANVEARISEVTLIKKFDRLAQNLSGQVLSDYMDWKLILSEVTYLDDRFLDVGFELDRVLQGSTERAAHWKECKNVLINVFPALIERVYIQRYMNVNATKIQIEEMFQNVKKEFHSMLDHNGWMDEQTKIEAFEKLQKLKVLIGYMDSIFNETKLEKLYSEFIVLPGQPFAETMSSLNILMNQKSLLQLLDPVEVEFSSLGINGFYYPIKNVIVLTGGILQGVFFNSTTRPISMNYGSIGVVLAHEITHGFDNNGRLHDESGNVRNWWKKETAAAFQKQKQCFIDQYDSITVNGLDGLHINGNMTQGENIADNGGMRAAYNAMKIALEESPIAAQQKIKGLEEYSAEQLFFINYAFSWCTNQRPEAAIFGAVYDVHSPPEARVNVVLANMPQFSNHFKCPSGTEMNPRKRCQVW